MRRAHRHILSLFLMHPWRVAGGVACLLVTDAAQLSIPLVVRQVVDGISDKSLQASGVTRGALILLGLSLTIALFRFLWRHFFFSASRKAEVHLRQRVYDHALTLSAEEFSSTRTGTVMALAVNDVESVRQALAMGFVAGFDATGFALVALGAMFALDPALTALVILPMPLLAGVMFVSLRAVYNRWDAVQSSFEAMTEKARESVAGIRVLKAYNQGEGDAADFDRHGADYFKKFMRYTVVDAMFHPLILLLAGSCLAILLGAGGMRVIDGRTGVGTFVALLTYLGMLVWPMIAGGWMLTLIQRASASMDRIDTFLDRVPQPTGAGADPGPLSGALAVRDLTFHFPGAERPALEGLSFELPAGGSLGVVGEIGSGKSVLVQLLARLQEPPPGTVFVGGHDVARLPLGRLRETLAYVPQEAFLFSDTIAENLRLGRPDATPGEMEAACRAAALHDEILGFPNGYETLLGERGITLSGGQKQRLCLARALLKPAPVLLLDDTLSAVDAEAERRILSALRDARSGRTTVLVSHRVSAVRELDRILVLHGGRAVQSGPHAELAAAPGFYREMVELQELER